MHTPPRPQIEALVSPMARGSSSPWRARLADESEDVMIKWRGVAQGSGPLVAEFVVARLAALWGAAVPTVRVAELPADYTRAGTDEFWDVLAGSVGPNLAMQWIEGRELSASEAGSMSSQLRAFVAAVDLCFDNHDRSPANPNLMGGAGGKVWLIDHGACLFFTKLREPAQFSFVSGHLLEARAPRGWLGPWRPPTLDERAVRLALQDLPPAWLEPLGWTLAALSDAVARRLAEFGEWLEAGEV